jgi:hypothetical protein
VQTRDTIFGFDNEIDGQEPSCQRQFNRFKDSPTDQRCLMCAIGTLLWIRCSYGIGMSTGTTWTGKPIRPSDLEKLDSKVLFCTEEFE